MIYIQTMVIHHILLLLLAEVGWTQLAGIAPAGSLDQATMVRIVNRIQQKLKRDNDLIADFIQLGFHMCVGENGCDGCIALNDPHNTGLITAYTTIQKMHSRFSTVINFADYAALVAIETVKFAVRGANCSSKKKCEATIPFRTGRITCPDINNAASVIMPDGDKLGGLEFLQREFGLTVDESIALLGLGHTLGKATRSFSGFNGQWDLTPNVADNGYFRSMLSGSWTATPIGNTTQWNSGSLMMLHADMEANWILKLSEPNRTPKCHVVSDCPLASSKSTVKRYSTNINAWLADAIPAFTKMIEKTRGSLQEVLGI